VSITPVGTLTDRSAVEQVDVDPWAASWIEEAQK
jgi:hypothetical protein